jgi:hypothetical protein
MPRTLTAEALSELSGSVIGTVLFIEAEFSGGPVRFWSGPGPLTWDGKLWTGSGKLLSISEITETGGVEATGLTLTLSGVPSDLIAIAYGEFVQGRPCRVWQGFLTASNEVIASPHLVTQGRMDTVADRDDGAFATISVTVESNLTDLQRLRVRRFTDQDQQRFFPGDRGLEYVARLQNQEIPWGRAGGASSGSGQQGGPSGQGGQNRPG